MSEYPSNPLRLRALLDECLAINSPSRHEEGMAALVAHYLHAAGAEVTTDSAAITLGGDTSNILATVPGTGPGPTLLFCAHLDTVEPTPELVVVEADGRLHTDGRTILGADDKAGVAAILELVLALQESGTPHPPLEIVFTVAEEVGLMGSQLLAAERLTARCGFVPDSSGAVGLIITHAPAQKHLHVRMHGVAAHAGMAPERGINAITVAAQAIAALRQGRIDAETTANIGRIHGGKATNIVPDLVEVEGEARSRDPEKLAAQVAHMRAVFEAAAHAAGVHCEVSITDVYPAFTLAPDALPVRLAADALTALGLHPTIAATGGGSDANFLNGFGIPTVILSTGYHHPHCTNEFLELDQLELLVQQLFEIVRLAGTVEA
jgi:tripeptide aminopeptidase